MEAEERDELVRTAIDLALSGIFKSVDALKNAAVTFRYKNDPEGIK